MYDPTFGPTELDRCIRDSDSKQYPNLTSKDYRKNQIDRACLISKTGFANLNLQKNNLAGRTIYQLLDLPSDLVLRKAVKNLFSVSSIKQANRIEICRCLRLLCEEGVPFTLARFDIRNFYESIDSSHIQDLVDRRLSTLPGTRRVLSTFMQQCEVQRVPGLPRGLAISAALSELYLNDFDKRIQRKLDTHFYARYVDDVVMLLSPEFNSRAAFKKIALTLPPGLTLNKNKSKVLNFGSSRTNNCQIEHQFDFLGYSFSVSQIKTGSNGMRCRDVMLEISKSKLKRTKTRIIRALIQYHRDRNFDDLLDRFKLLTCNYKFYDHQYRKKRLVGLHHNYGLINPCSKSLEELDLFVKHVIIGQGGMISGIPSGKPLTNPERRKLLRLSFSAGFKKRIHFNFSAQRIKHLVECWKYA